MEFLQVCCLCLVGFISFGIAEIWMRIKQDHEVKKKTQLMPAGNEFILNRHRAVIK